MYAPLHMSDVDFLDILGVSQCICFIILYMLGVDHDGQGLFSWYDALDLLLCDYAYTDTKMIIVMNYAKDQIHDWVL